MGDEKPHPSGKKDELGLNYPKLSIDKACG